MFTLLISATLAKWLGALVLAYGLYSLWGTFGARQAAPAAAARRDRSAGSAAA